MLTSAIDIWMTTAVDIMRSLVRYIDAITYVEYINFQIDYVMRTKCSCIRLVALSRYMLSKVIEVTVRICKILFSNRLCYANGNAWGYSSSDTNAPQCMYSELL